jgi:ABC-type dipeptide/oligopeptide/nickel transport system permease component
MGAGLNDVSLLITYFVALVLGQAIAVGVGLAVERVYSPYIGLMVFIPLYFIVFWIAWLFAVRITRPRTTEPRT